MSFLSDLAERLSEGSLAGSLFGSSGARENARSREQQANEVFDFQRYMDDSFREESEPTRGLRNEYLQHYQNIINGNTDNFRQGPEYTGTLQAAESAADGSGRFESALRDRAQKLADGEFNNYYGRIATGADISSRGLNSTNAQLQANTNARARLLQGTGNNIANDLVSEANANAQGATGIATLVGSLFSDERIKTDKKKVGEMKDGTAIYTYKDETDGLYKMGVIAQEAMKKHPEAVTQEPQSKLLMLNYRKL